MPATMDYAGARARRRRLFFSYTQRLEQEREALWRCYREAQARGDWQSAAEYRQDYNALVGGVK